MKPFRLPLIATCLFMTLAACSSGPSDIQGSIMERSYIRLAPSAPPARYYETKPMSPAPMLLTWRAGYWDYDGVQFFWVPGYYIEKPNPTAAWTPDRWERRQFGWAFIPGYWQ
ncbi:MAG: hypothetical protein EOM37_00870 [Proteobacteria bacterium]|jgi:hypothetical protein|nr:hypothetical protein [Alphaproteobacteria bacterium]NCC02592.1 hypothetical protein [Pseudomonadota bacterium]